MGEDAAAEPVESPAAEVLAVQAPSVPADGLVEEGGSTYLYEGGERVSGERYAGGAWRYFDPAEGGAMAESRWVDLRGPGEGYPKRVYYGEGGAMAYGELCQGGYWYYLDPVTGAMDTEWALIPDGAGGAKWVYYGLDGRMVHGEAQVDGAWYLFDEWTGATTYGFALLQGPGEGYPKWVFYDRMTGKMLYGEQFIDGGWYYLTPAPAPSTTTGR